MKQWIFIFVLLTAPLLHATNAVYISDAGAGTQDGSSCANAKPHSYFNTAGNWSATPTGIQIGPDTTVHTCGTFTGALNATELQFQGSGTSGHPVILFMETGTDFTSPAWNNSGGTIDCNGQSFWTIDGGTNGTIENTDNGDWLDNQNATEAISSSTGVFCNNATVKDLIIKNIYIKVQGINDNANSCGPSHTALCPGDNTQFMNFLGHDVLVTRNTMSYAAEGVALPGQNGTANQEVSFNTITFCSRCVVLGTGPAQGSTGISIHDNDFGGGAYLWDNTANNYHHDVIQLVCESNTQPCMTNPQIYNNYVHGVWSTTGHTTSFFFGDDYTTSKITGLVQYNNVISSDSGDVGVASSYLSGATGGTTVANNTILLNPTSGGNGCNGMQPSPSFIYNNILAKCGNALYAPNGTTGLTVDYNLYYSLAGSGWANDTFAQWQSAGFDAHGQNGNNPNLNANFTLSAGSPAIGAGKNLTSSCSGSLAGLCTGAPQTFGRTGACGTGCVPRAASGAWDQGAYPFSNAPPVLPSPAFSMFSLLNPLEVP